MQRKKMNRSEDLANRLQEVLIDGHWIAGTNYKSQILAISSEQATFAIGQLNTIARLIFHVNYYLAGILEVFDGGELKIKDQFSFPDRSIASESDWLKLVDEFLGNSHRVVDHVREMSDETLDATFVDSTYGSCQRNIEGVIEHSYYHLGQVSMLRKLSSAP